MTEAQILLLLAVRLRSRAAADDIKETFITLGGEAPRFESLLADAESLDQVRVRGEEPRRSLTGAGEAELAAHLGAETERVGRADLVTAYEAFLPLNRAFLAALSTSASPGDVAVAEVASLVVRLGPVLAALEEKLDRFAGYAARFAAAVSRAGTDPRWVAGASIDSIHTIWFELHEHLLATLGRDRSQESALQ